MKRGSLIPPSALILRNAAGASRRMLQMVREPPESSFETRSFRISPQDEGLEGVERASHRRTEGMMA